jgi:predicted O-methyltransferase YrrM
MTENAVALRDAFGFLYVDELPFLQRLAAQCPPHPVFVNIGAGAGTSALTLVEARADALLFTVDIQFEGSPHGSLEGEQNAFRNAGLIGLLNRVWFQVHGDSKLVGQHWLTSEWDFPPPERRFPLDLVFIDGDHSYEGCAGDIRVWTPLIRPNGILVIHDYDNHRKQAAVWPGVNDAVEQLCLEHPEQYQLIGQVDTMIAFTVLSEA